MAHRMIRRGSSCFRSSLVDGLQQHAVEEVPLILRPPTIGMVVQAEACAAIIVQAFQEQA